MKITSLILGVLCGLAFAGCSPAPLDETHLKPANGAFGYFLAATNTDDLACQIITDTPPFTELFVDKTSDGRICRIAGVGTVEQGEIYDTKKRLRAVLIEKYGERPRALGDTAAIADEVHYFGTKNRAVSMAISDYHTNAMMTVEYYDADLMTIYRAEQRAKDQLDEQKKKAALDHGL